MVRNDCRGAYYFCGGCSRFNFLESCLSDWNRNLRMGWLNDISSNCQTRSRVIFFFFNFYLLDSGLTTSLLYQIYNIGEIKVSTESFIRFLLHRVYNVIEYLLWSQNRFSLQADIHLAAALLAKSFNDSSLYTRSCCSFDYSFIVEPRVANKFDEYWAYLYPDIYGALVGSCLRRARNMHRDSKIRRAKCKNVGFA